MEAVILAAGEGSRLERETDHLPKIFVEINGVPLYIHQLRALDEFCDRVLFMLGHGFEDNTSPAQAFDIPSIISADIDFKILPQWSDYENSYTTMKALEEIDSHVLLVCGDVIFSEDVTRSLITEFQETYESKGKNVVGALKGIQDEMTAVRTGSDGEVSAYGAIKGHQEVGLFLLHKSNIPRSISVLQKNTDYWFPIIFEKTPSCVVYVAENERHEINNEDHLSEARDKFQR
jgi:choline kinase